MRKDNCAPPSTDTLTAINQNKWKYWQIVFRLNNLILLLTIFYNMVISLIEEISGQVI